MYNVLLADDEILDLEGMKRFIPWESLGMRVVGSVNNGFSACEMLENEKIDILVSDIRMPNMTGLELAQKAIEMQEHIQIIFVSGYQDFGYVKQALALNACSYVLKPMDDQELIDALQKVKQELDRYRKREETEAVYKQMIPLVKHQYLLQLLEQPYTSLPPNMLQQEYRLNEIKWPSYIVILEVDDISWQLQHTNGEGMQRVAERVTARLPALFEERGIVHYCKLSSSRTAVLLHGEADRDKIQSLLKKLREELSVSVTIGAGEEVYGLDGIHASYKQAAAALDYKMFCGKGRWICYSDVPPEDKRDAENLDLRLDSLFSAMNQYDLVRIHDELEQVLALASAMRSKFTVRNLAVYIIMKLDEYLHTMHKDLFKMLGMEFTNLDVLLQFETVEEIFSWLRRKVFEISEHLQNQGGTRNGRLVQEMIEDVKQRLHESVTLRDVANRFSFSPNYLGAVFKEETGRNFSDFLIGLRMEKARELLETTKVKIYEIAAQTGYQYLPYFSRQFKETYGMTPLEYRRKHQ